MLEHIRNAYMKSLKEEHIRESIYEITSSYGFPDFENYPFCL